MASPTLHLSSLLLSLLCTLPPFIASDSLLADKNALIDFAAGTSHARALRWDLATSPCVNWTGVSCGHGSSRVVALRLPGFGLRGRILPKTLARLSALQVLSLRSNAFVGTLPSDLADLSNLTALHLQDNSLSGSLPLSFSNLTRLAFLNLAENSLSGHIPDLRLRNLKFLNLSYNHFAGSIPPSLQQFPTSSFAGNDLSPVQPSAIPAPPPPKKLRLAAVLGITAAGCTLGLAALAAVMILCCFRGNCEGPASDTRGKTRKGQRSPEKDKAGSQEGSNRLVFFDQSTSAFDLEDLLRASAEVLGKGTYGAAYKAVLEDGTTVVVKRLTEVAVGRREFEQQMEVLGTIRHENVVALRAYYYSKDEKLMVYEYCRHGSVSSLLHGMLIIFLVCCIHCCCATLFCYVGIAFILDSYVGIAFIHMI
ncbi:putative inactive receptor kinase [Apostasia shenzhenica]|uniref:Putative inactive receptor kinase n=1 Tax=Apostasia shenzhenica TaxID=1088818 RepID=A0A2I0BFU6_9ASPA|nr:putative inactive receptor kinase [Apostasia shenzhenica]